VASAFPSPSSSTQHHRFPGSEKCGKGKAAASGEGDDRQQGLRQLWLSPSGLSHHIAYQMQQTGGRLPAVEAGRPLPRGRRAMATVVGTANSGVDSGDDAAIANCPVCNMVIVGKQALRDHVVGHASPKPFQCPSCNKSFAIKGNLTQHLRIHLGERPYPCDQCEKSFTQRGSLVKHLRVHSGEKPFECTECGKRFSVKVNLKKHRGTHSSERPFTCTICGKSFAVKPYLTQHMATHSGSKPYQCTLCDRRFTRKGNLTQHITLHAQAPMVATDSQCAGGSGANNHATSTARAPASVASSSPASQEYQHPGGAPAMQSTAQVAYGQIVSQHAESRLQQQQQYLQQQHFVTQPYQRQVSVVSSEGGASSGHFVQGGRQQHQYAVMPNTVMTTSSGVGMAGQPQLVLIPGYSHPTQGYQQASGPVAYINTQGQVHAMPAMQSNGQTQHMQYMQPHPGNQLPPQHQGVDAGQHQYPQFSPQQLGGGVPVSVMVRPHVGAAATLGQQMPMAPPQQQQQQQQQHYQPLPQPQPQHHQHYQHYQQQYQQQQR